jgi:sugar phosphate isomerase/epimerase
MNTATSLNVLFDGSFKVSAIDQLKRVNAAGFRFIDMNFWDWSHSPESPFMRDDWTSWVENIKDAGDKLGVTFHQAHAHVFNPFAESDSSANDRKAAERSVIGAGILGVKWVVFHAQTFEPGNYELNLKKNNEWLSHYVDLAVKHNTGIALENFTDGKTYKGYCTAASHLIELTDSFKSPNVGNCWDIGHAHIQGVDQYSEIMALGKRLKVLHVQDNNAVSDWHIAPFYGTVDWNVIKNALRDVEYEGDFTFEAHTLIRAVPEDCKDAALKLLFDIGEHFVK